MKEIDLDLSSVHLYGWERYKLRARIDLFLQALDAGKTFPPVFVCAIRGKEYHLDKRPRDAHNKDHADGGHHRALAHYLSHRPLRAIITGETPFVPSYSYLIGELEIVEGPGISISASVLRERSRS